MLAISLLALAALPTPSDACVLVAEDYARYRLADAVGAEYQRYLWLPPWSTERTRGAVVFAINTAVSSSHSPQKPVEIAGGWVQRWDLRLLAPDPEDLKRTIRLWDGLSRIDPYFHEPLEKPFVTTPYVRDGRTYTAYHIGRLGVHLGRNGDGLRAIAGDRPGLIYRADWFLSKCLSTLDGGRYYDFAGIERNPAKGTSFDAFLAKLGSSEKQVFELGGDNRAGLLFSGVTAKARRVDVFRGLAGRRGGGIISVTHDLADGPVVDAKHPLLNLLDFKDDAREVIAEKPNGFHYFVLFDGKGALQDSAPDNVVSDHTVPPPHTTRLQSAISCIRCHGPQDGWKPITNDVRTLLAGNLAILDDFSNKNLTPDQIRDRLNAAYAYDPQLPDGVLDRGRRDYARTVQQACGDEPDRVADAVSTCYQSIVYDLVTPAVACRELGVDAGDDPFANPFIKAVGSPPAIAGVVREDAIIACLKAGIPVTRADWESRYRIAALRVQLNQKE